MISENDKNEMCRMRRLGFTLDYIAKATGYSASSVANVTACVERPLASSGKDKQIEAMIHNSKKIEINDRIRLTSILMGGGRFWYMPEAGTLRDALASAMWSGKHPGMDERLDDGTTDIDTLDAFEYTIERDYKRYLRLTE